MLGRLRGAWGLVAQLFWGEGGGSRGGSDRRGQLCQRGQPGAGSEHTGGPRPRRCDSKRPAARGKRGDRSHRERRRQQQQRTSQRADRRRRNETRHTPVNSARDHARRRRSPGVAPESPPAAKGANAPGPGAQRGGLVRYGGSAWVAQAAGNPGGGKGWRYAKGSRRRRTLLGRAPDRRSVEGGWVGAPAGYDRWSCVAAPCGR